MAKGNTRIVVRALTEKGRKSLLLQKIDEIELRERYKGWAKWKIPSDVRSYLKTVSVFMPKDESPVEHQILGFRRMKDKDKTDMYNGIKSSFEENGCSLDDFEVSFHDA